MGESLLDKFTILDVLENFYRDDINSIAARYAKAVAEDPDGARAKDLRDHELLDIYSETWANPLYEREKTGDFLLPSLKEGELRLPISPSPREIASAAYVPLGAKLWTYSARNQWSPDVLLPSIKRTLLYAHSVVIDCQIAERPFGNKSMASTSDWLQILAQLAPLIRKGIVFVVPLPNATSLPLWQRQSQVGVSFGSPKDHNTRAMDAWFDLLPELVDCWVSFQAGQFELLNGRCGLSVPPMGHWNLEERLLTRINESFREIAATQRRDETLVLNEIGSLSLPGLSDLKISEIATIREADAFTEFRVALRSALAGSVKADGQVDQANFKEEMTTEIRKLERSVKEQSIPEPRVSPRRDGTGRPERSASTGWRSA